jgi:hypothetical protein
MSLARALRQHSSKRLESPTGCGLDPPASSYGRAMSSLASSMNCVRLAAAFAVALVSASLSFAADIVAPDINLKAEGVPPIPAALAAKVAPYTEFKPTTIVDWHPERRELIVARRAGNVTQLHRVTAPRTKPEQLTAFSEPVRFGAYLAKKPGVLVLARDTGGNEQPLSLINKNEPTRLSLIA